MDKGYGIRFILSPTFVIMEYIEFKNVGFSYKDEKFSFHGLSLQINGGVFSSIFIGEGKTAFASLLSGIIKPDRGSIINNHKTKVIFKNLDNQLFGATTLEDIKMTYYSRYNIDGFSDDEITHILNIFQLEGVKNKPLQMLSVEMKLRTLIAGIVSTKPEFLVFDDVFQNVDGSCFYSIIKIIKTYCQDVSIINITNNIDEIMFSDVVYIIGNEKEEENQLKENYVLKMVPDEFLQDDRLLDITILYYQKCSYYHEL